MTVALQRGGQKAIGLSDVTTTVMPDNSVQKGAAPRIDPDTQVQVIAFYDPGSDNLVASRVITVAEDPNAPATAARARRPAGKVKAHAAAGWETGIASWFCCGNVGGCGQCYGVGSGGGACGGCRSDYHHMAWPELTTGCGPYCDNCCLRADFPRLPCGQGIRVWHYCDSHYVDCTIKDCGPLVRCRSAYGCGALVKIMFDLTPCAFSVIGDLASGLVDVQCSW
jgi:hypothetical protein